MKQNYAQLPEEEKEKDRVVARALLQAIRGEQGVAEAELDEKSVSQAQFRTMAGAAHNPEFARKVGISQDVAQEFNQADKKSNYKKLPARATEGEQQKGADYRDPKEVDYDDANTMPWLPELKTGWTGSNENCVRSCQASVSQHAHSSST
jgi:hypothetical protein